MSRRDELRAKVRAILDGPPFIINCNDGTRKELPSRVWCGCYEGDMGDLYPATAAEVTEAILDLIEEEAAEAFREGRE